MAMSSASTPADAVTPAPTTEDARRRVLFVAGSGRSGTSTMSGILQTLGMHVPQPEVAADETNPRGFGEPQWVVDLHEELLRRCRVQNGDARPQAWFETGRMATFERLRKRVHLWLEDQFVQGGTELVIKDPRMAWFIGLWRSAALASGAAPAYVTMLRPVTEVVGSKQRYYASKAGEVNRTAAWVNMMLGTERATRGSERGFVRYHDLLRDWTVPVFELGEHLELGAVQTASPVAIRKVHNFVDPGLRRVQLTWDDLDVPPALREIAQETWVHLDALVDPAADLPAHHAVLDDLRQAYNRLYEEAEALAHSTAVAARLEGVAPAARPAPATTIDKVPHRLRAMVPPRARQSIRRAIGRER